MTQSQKKKEERNIQQKKKKITKKSNARNITNFFKRRSQKVNQTFIYYVVTPFVSTQNISKDKIIYMQNIFLKIFSFYSVWFVFLKIHKKRRSIFQQNESILQFHNHHMIGQKPTHCHSTNHPNHH